MSSAPMGIVINRFYCLLLASTLDSDSIIQWLSKAARRGEGAFSC
jgi:hypothetical protein